MTNDNKTISHPTEPMRVGSLVRWHEYPDRLYYILEMNINHCGYNNCCKIEDIKHQHRAIVHDTDLTLDDVDYDEL